MGKIALTVWLLLPVVIVTILWFSVDRDRAQPHLESGVTPSGPSEPQPGSVPWTELIPARPVDSASAATDAQRAEQTGAGTGRVLAYGRLERLKLESDSSLPAVVEGVEEVLVWVPPRYGAMAQPRDYPVLYMVGGAELFGTPIGGGNATEAWRLDQWLGNAIENDGLAPTLVVAVPACASEEAFVKLVEAVKPRMDKAYAAGRGPEKTLIGGGGEVGGRRALIAATARPGLFGGVAAQSPKLFDEGRAFFRRVGQAPTWPSRVYVGIGAWDLGRPDVAGGEAYEGLNHQNELMLRGLSELLDGRGVKPENRMLVLDAKTAGEPTAWARRTRDAVRFLLAADNAMKQE